MGEREWTSRVGLRPGRLQDFDYCAALYFAVMDDLIGPLKLNRTAQIAGFRHRWRMAEVRIITLDGADIGWLQSRTYNDALFLSQFFLDAPFRQQGIGTEIMKRLIAEAAHLRLAMALEVVKINPALRLYERLGFRITREDERKFHMRRDAGRRVPESHH